VNEVSKVLLLAQLGVPAAVAAAVATSLATSLATAVAAAVAVLPPSVQVPRKES